MSGAGNGIRTRDFQLGKLTLYQLSYARISFVILIEGLWFVKMPVVIPGAARIPRRVRLNGFEVRSSKYGGKSKRSFSGCSRVGEMQGRQAVGVIEDFR